MAFLEIFCLFRIVLRLRGIIVAPPMMVQTKFVSQKSYYLCITNNEIVQNSKSEPKKFSFLFTFKGRLDRPSVNIHELSLYFPFPSKDAERAKGAGKSNFLIKRLSLLYPWYIPLYISSVYMVTLSLHTQISHISTHAE